MGQQNSQIVIEPLEPYGIPAIDVAVNNLNREIIKLRDLVSNQQKARDIFVSAMGMREIAGDKARVHVPHALISLVIFVLTLSTSTEALEIDQNALKINADFIQDCEIGRKIIIAYKYW